MLITLGIIGVVAALTIPSLLAKFQQKSYSTAFKKQYSVLNNAINFLELNESISECYHTTYICPTETNPDNRCYSSNNVDCPALKNRLISMLNLTPIEKDDFVYAKRDDVLSNGGVVVVREYSYDGILDYLSSAYMLSDGAVVMFTPNNIAGYADVVFVLDINGKKAPNRWGYDVFWLILSKHNDKLRLTDEYASISEKGGSLPRNILMNKWTNENATIQW